MKKTMSRSQYREAWQIVDRGDETELRRFLLCKGFFAVEIASIIHLMNSIANSIDEVIRTDKRMTINEYLVRHTDFGRET